MPEHIKNSIKNIPENSSKFSLKDILAYNEKIYGIQILHAFIPSYAKFGMKIAKCLGVGSSFPHMNIPIFNENELSAYDIQRNISNKNRSPIPFP